MAGGFVQRTTSTLSPTSAANFRKQRFSAYRVPCRRYQMRTKPTNPTPKMAAADMSGNRSAGACQ
eukprot:3858212-Rhodomonas_salina.3